MLTEPPTIKLWSFDVRSEGAAAIPLTARLGQSEGSRPGYI
jgi:hypothetical protein